MRTSLWTPLSSTFAFAVALAIAVLRDGSRSPGGLLEPHGGGNRRPVATFGLRDSGDPLARQC